jgi:hypothetical protein
MKWKMKLSDLFTLIVFVLGGAGLLLVLAQLLVDYRARRSPVSSDKKPEYELAAFDTADPRATRRGALEMWGWVLALIASVRLFGLQVSVPLFVLAYSKTYGAKWLVSIGMTVFIVAFLFVVYEQVMHIYWPEPLLLELFRKFFGT